MVGQKQLQSEVFALIDAQKYPRFSLFVGERGAEQDVLAIAVANKTGGNVYTCSSDVASVRNMVYESYKMQTKMCYLLYDVDSVSIAAKNALLKVTEEPPNNAYFIMTAQNENAVSAAIRSRAPVFRLQPYKKEELVAYAKKSVGSVEELDIISSICDTPGEIDILRKNGVKEFYAFVRLVFDNIAEVSLANAFKISSSISLKEEQGGYDFILFLKAFSKMCIEQAVTDESRRTALVGAVDATSQILRSLKITGVSKSMLFDKWIIDVRTFL